MPSRVTSTGAKLSGWAKACPKGFKWSDASSKCVKTERERRQADVFYSMGPLTGGQLNKTEKLRVERQGSSITMSTMPARGYYTIADLPMPKVLKNPTGYKIKKR